MNGSCSKNGKAHSHADCEEQVKRKKERRESYSCAQRPDLYPVAKPPQRDYLESLFKKQKKSPHLEGAINLAFMMFTILILQSTYRQVYSNGFMLFSDLQLLGCVMGEIGLIYLYDLIEGALTIPMFAIYSLFVKNYIGKRTLLILYVGYQVAFLAVSFKLKWNLTPFFAMISIMGTVVFVLKMHSFVATNLLLHNGNGTAKVSTFAMQNPAEIAKETRTRLKSIVDSEACYPRNVNLKNFFYFIFCAPSLVYETRFLRTQRIRVWYVLKELCAFMFCSAGVLWIMAQFVLPVTTSPTEDTIASLLSDLSLVCVPSFILWLIGFYAYFHCWLSAKSELVGYANREFYEDWWNASSIGEFWRKWNKPVHEWCLRHLYIESMYYFNTTKVSAACIVFFVSALLHETVASYGFKAYKPYFFVAMLGQAPLLYLNNKIRESSKRMGNIVMWISLMLGQPLLAVLYFRNWSKSGRSTVEFWCA